jgi:type I restriction enzyme M protein
VLRLPTGIFYAQGVKTNVLFFTRGKSDKGQHEGDLGLRPPREHAELRQAHAADAGALRGLRAEYKRGERAEQAGPSGRWRCFTREEVKKRGDNLDIAWLKDTSNGAGEALEEPEVIAAQIAERLESALAEVRRCWGRRERTEASCRGLGVGDAGGGGERCGIP